MSTSRHRKQVYINVDQFCIDHSARTNDDLLESPDLTPFFNWLVHAPEGYSVHIWYRGCWKPWRRVATATWLIDQMVEWAQDPRHRQALAYCLGHGFLLLNPEFAEQLIPQWCADVVKRLSQCWWVPSNVHSFDYWAGFIYRFPVLEDGATTQVLRLHSGELASVKD